MEERTSVTYHETCIDGRTLAYTATAGTLHLRRPDGEPRARVFYVAYTADRVEDPQKRPVTFAFNGGPGSSSVWLQLGALGPRRIDLPDGVASPPPPYAVVDNACGILDLTDLVFIDPVDTGFSRPEGEAKGADFHGVAEDVESVAEFIRRWLSRNHRWNAPRFLAGESYGTTRAAGLARHLQEQGVALNGLVLISLALNFQTFVFETGNDLPYVLYLPAYAAAAWYHDRLEERPDDLHAWIDEARRWAVEVYAPALMHGAALVEARQQAIAEGLAHFTGMDAQTIRDMNLRVEYLRFAKTLLGRPGHTIGRLDCRYVGPDSDPLSGKMTRDPSYDAPLGAYTAVVNDYLRRELRFDATDEYEVLSMAVNAAWRWESDERMGYVNVSDDLRRAMVHNPHLKVLFANGLFDLATPAFAAEYTADHLGLPAELRENVTLSHYEAGHMMYFHAPSRRKLRADLVEFYTPSV